MTEAAVPEDGRAFLPLALACGLAVSVPFWVGRFLPFLDLPQHLALATVLRHHDDPAWGLAPYFEAQWGEFTPYWTHYLVWHALGTLVGLETAVRLHLTLYAMALPVAAGAFCAAWGRPRRLGLLAAPLALNTNLYLGFVAYVTAGVLLLFALALLLRQRDSPTPGRALGLAVLGVLLFFTHVQAFAFLLLSAAVLAWRSVRTWLPLAVVALVLLVPWIRLSTTNRPGAQRYFPDLDQPRAEFVPAPSLLRDLPRAVAGAFQDRSDRGLLLAWAAALAGALWATRRSLEPRPQVWVLPGLALACYALLPFSIQGQWNVNHRFAWLLALFLVATPRAVPRWLAPAAAVLTAAVGANAAWHHARFDREVGAFDQALLAIPRGQRVMGLIFDQRGSVVETWPYLHFAQYAVVRQGGVASHSFAQNAPLPVRQRIPLPAANVWRPDEFRFDAQGGGFDYFLLRGGPEAGAIFGKAGVERVYDDGTWRVFYSGSGRIAR
jgi:hypothetical protein